AVLALNVAVVLGLVVLTLLFGRVYCSVICPLGVFQDIVSRLRGRKGKHRYRFSYSPALNRLRYVVLALFVIALVAGFTSFAAVIAPYSAYGRMVQNLLSPIYIGINNLLAYCAERADSYAFYEKEVWVRSIGVFAVAAVTFVVLVVLALRNGRTYCNTICPVGTVLGFLSRFSLLKPVIDSSKCNACGLCAKGCKASCIDSKNHKIDYSRCVACFDCIDNCRHGAISYKLNRKTSASEVKTSGVETGADGRREFLASGVAIAAAAVAGAQSKTVDGGLAVILDKKVPSRNTPIVPPGAKGVRHFRQHCTGCQLCVAACPNGVLRPSGNVENLMQPEASYERGYCRPECTHCSEVCPAGAIHKISIEDKSSTQVGHAVWVKENCVPLTDGVSCGNCARHCPAGAITMVLSDASNPESPKIPVVNEERCIGCGACENLCPARPFSAIYVEGHQVHREI
ncbi:MAG: 4Fe-4S binding protein, partial [Muribaculaceae bacterium]|nr:4Fe-4S binding protein [Muribaculaceae bacterium]